MPQWRGISCHHFTICVCHHKILKYSVTHSNTVLMQPSYFSNRLGPVGEKSALEATVHFALSDELSSIHWSKEQQPLIWTVQGVFTPSRGHCSVTAHQRATSKACQKYQWVWTEAGNFTAAVIHCAPRMTEGRERHQKLLFTLPYLLFILLQNFTRTIANLHTWVEHRWTKQQPKKKYFSSKKA